MLAGAPRRILRIRARSSSFTFGSQLTFGLQPVLHIATIHSTFTLKNLVGALRDFVATERAGETSIPWLRSGTSIA
jgi:hypothetical protein